MSSDSSQFIKYEIIKVSNSDIFNELVHKTYDFISFLDNFYPEFNLWFYEKVVPGLMSGEREIFCAIEDDEVIGVAITKRTCHESKICTLYVDKAHRGKGVGALLVKTSADWLQTDVPTFSAPLSVYGEVECFFKKTGLVVIKKRRVEQSEVVYN